MTVFQILPILSLLATVTFIIGFALRDGIAWTSHWLWPAVVAGAFAAWTGATVLSDGLTMFWVNHATNFTGNQVFFDLLIAVVIAFVALAPEAKRQGMSLLPWALFVCATASIGLTAMLARLLYLKGRKAAQPTKATTA